MCLAHGSQGSDANETRTRGPLVSSQALYHWATTLPLKNLKVQKQFGSWSGHFGLFSQTPCIHLGIPRRGVKIDNFFSYLTYVTAKFCMHRSRGGQRARPPPPPLEKHKLYGILTGISNWILPPPPRKNVGAPLEPRKIVIFFEINHWHSVK